MSKSSECCQFQRSHCAECGSGRDADKDGSGLISAKELYKAIIQGEAEDGTGSVKSCHRSAVTFLGPGFSEKRRRGIDRNGKPMVIGVEIDRSRQQLWVWSATCANIQRNADPDGPCQQSAVTLMSQSRTQEMSEQIMRWDMTTGKMQPQTDHTIHDNYTYITIYINIYILIYI